MGKRRWACINEILVYKPNYIQEFERIRIMQNPDWHNQIESMKTFQTVENHSYYISFQYLCVDNAKRYNNIEVIDVIYDKSENELKVSTRKYGVKTLISLEIISFKNTFYEPESSDDIVKASFW